MELKKPLILASSSPRRQYLMKEVGLRFTIAKPDVEEIFPESLAVASVASYLANIKADSLIDLIQDEIVVTADTVVILGNRILNKPADRNEAIGMLSSLAGNTHRVMTGVCLFTKETRVTFEDTTDVTFEKLTRKQIEHYIDHFQPYDKAGSYGAQDCLPADMNPCSQEEIRFLEKIGKEHLVSETVTKKRSDQSIVIIKKISGSYFNVMGLPVHKLYEHLKKWS